MKTRLNVESVTANYNCDKCESRQDNIPIQESIYNGPPICLNCGEEMTLDEVYYESSIE